MIGSLATRVRELSLRVADLEGLLEAAKRRIAVYEDFDAQVQDSLTAALRAANEIRERARISAEAMAQEAKAQRPASVRELDAMRIERDALRRVIDAASAPPAPAPAAPEPVAAMFPMSEMRTAAAEALRGVFKELVAELRATAPAPVAQYAPVGAAPVYVPPPQPAPVYAPPPAPVHAALVSVPPPQPAYTPPPAPVATQYAPPVPVAPAPRPAVVEDVDIAPHAPHAVPDPPTGTWAAPASEPVGEIQVVLSPIASFPRLVELERRLQGMPAVRTVYARDFRNGVATLAIGLRTPMTVDEFATAVTRLESPRLRIVSTTGYVLELRIESEASSIA